MNTVFKINRQDLHIGIMAGTGLTLLMLRIYLTSQISYLFLVWNLFLSVVPYLLVRWLRFRESENPIILITTALLWLLFLPNAPYLLTDFIHLSLRGNSLFWLDLLMLSSLSYSGLLMGYASMSLLEKKISLTGRLNHKYVLFFFKAGILGLCSLGMYLGRVLRWNSWDIVRRPDLIFTDIAQLFIYPFENDYAWFCILSFSVLLTTFYLIFNQLIYGNHES